MSYDNRNPIDDLTPLEYASNVDDPEPTDPPPADPSPPATGNG
jgi:hypothetical protein